MSDGSSEDESTGGSSCESGKGPSTAKVARLNPRSEAATDRIHPPQEDTISGKRYPVRPNAIKFVQVRKTHTNHSYRDFSCMPIDASYVYPASIDDMDFNEKLFHLLSYTPFNCRQVMDWCCRGRAFQILDPDGLERIGVLRCYFGYNNMQRFYKQLNNYGYKRLTRDSGDYRFYSEFLLQGMPHLLPYSPPPMKRRRQLPDPDNEPNFDDISLLYPLPSDRRATVTEARRRLEARGFMIADTVFEMVASRPASTQRFISPVPAPSVPGGAFGLFQQGSSGSYPPRTGPYHP